MVKILYHENIWAGLPARLGQDILLKVFGRVSRNSLLWRQDLQGYLVTLIMTNDFFIFAKFILMMNHVVLLLLLL